MPRSKRSENLDLIRHLHGGHKPVARKLNSIANENYLSQMATGGREITDHEAQQIEKALALPDGWMDRDHLAMFDMSKVDYDIYSNLSAKPEAAKAGLLVFLTMPDHE